MDNFPNFTQRIIFLFYWQEKLFKLQSEYNCEEISGSRLMIIDYKWDIVVESWSVGSQHTCYLSIRKLES